MNFQQFNINKKLEMTSILKIGYITLVREVNLTLNKEETWHDHVSKTRELFVDIRDWFSPSADREHSHLNCSYFHDSKY